MRTDHILPCPNARGRHARLHPACGSQVSHLNIAHSGQLNAAGFRPVACAMPAAVAPATALALQPPLLRLGPAAATPRFAGGTVVGSRAESQRCCVSQAAPGSAGPLQVLSATAANAAPARHPTGGRTQSALAALQLSGAAVPTTPSAVASIQRCRHGAAWVLTCSRAAPHRLPSLDSARWRAAACCQPAASTKDRRLPREELHCICNIDAKSQADSIKTRLPACHWVLGAVLRASMGDMASNSTLADAANRSICCSTRPAMALHVTACTLFDYIYFGIPACFGIMMYERYVQGF